MEHFAEAAPELLAAFGIDYCDYVQAGKGGFDFDYCDVISDKLVALFELGDVALKARVLVELLVLGTSHNRWLVEHRFMRLADLALSENVAKRFITEASVQNVDLAENVAHLERSISVVRGNLHPIIQQALK